MLLRLVRQFLAGYRRPLAIVVALQFVGTVAALYLPSLNADIIDNGVVSGDTGYIVRIGALMLGVAVLQIVCSVGAVWFGARTAMGFGRDVRAAIFHRVGSFSQREVQHFGAPSLITRETNDVQQVQMLVLMSCTLMVMAPIMMVGGVIMAMREDLGLSWLIAVTVPVLALPLWGAALANVGAWAAIHTATGYGAHRLSSARLQRDTWLLRERRWEHAGALYVRTLRIKRWKDRLPEAGALFAGGVSKRHLPSRDRAGLTRFVCETRRGEYAHWAAMAGGPLSVLWNPPVGVALMVGYGIVVNAPFIAVQRSNRIRAQRLVDRATARSSGSGAREGPDDGPRSSGSSIP